MRGPAGKAVPRNFIPLLGRVLFLLISCRFPNIVALRARFAKTYPFLSSGHRSEIVTSDFSNTEALFRCQWIRAKNFSMKNEIILKSNGAGATLAQAVSPLFLHLTKTKNSSTVVSAHTSPGPRSIRLPTTFSVPQLRHFTEDSNTSQLVNFPFAFVVSIMVLSGVLAMGWGMVLAEVSLAVVGFILSLSGAALYGCSLSDD